MLNKEKIRLMTKLSIYEQGIGKKEIPMSRYFRSDYISINMVRTVISATITYILLVVMWLLYDLESLMDQLTEIDLFKVGRNILILYVAFIILYMVRDGVVAN